MTTLRTFKALACLMGAMTAVTVVLNLVEPWTVSLQAQSPGHRADIVPAPLPVLASVPAGAWNRLELVLAADGSTNLPDAHLLIQPDGRVEATRLWRLGQPLPQQVLRVCALYSGTPSDALLQRWLTTCDQAAQQTNMPGGNIKLSTPATSHRSATQVTNLKDLQGRLLAMLQQ